MRLGRRDGLATLLVTAAAVLYAMWATGGAMAGMPARWMTVIAFTLGVAACTANQRELGEVYGAAPGAPRSPGAYVALATAMGIVMLVAGIVAFVAASETMLATLVAAMVTLWLLSAAWGESSVVGNAHEISIGAPPQGYAPRLGPRPRIVPLTASRPKPCLAGLSTCHGPGVRLAGAPGAERYR
jgi:hypothetical protein